MLWRVLFLWPEDGFGKEKKSYLCSMKYRDYGKWLQEAVGQKVQKLSIDAGFSCPNRDGRLGRGGCIFCNNACFVPAYCRRGLSVGQQIEEGKRFFSRKYSQAKFLAYFQSYSNTYAELPVIECVFGEALSADDVVGIVVGTRPDCVSPALLDYLADLSRQVFVCVEYGVQSMNDETLLRINRGHDAEASAFAIRETALRGIHVGAHVILGFPWEGHDELMSQAERLARLPLTALKLHQLQVLKGTELARLYAEKPWPMPSAEAYIRLALEYVSHFPDGIVLDRLAGQCPPDMVLAPKWGLKSHEFAAIVRRELNAMDWKG